MNSVDTIARRVTLRELRLLLAVARSGSILKAANEIGLTQPALSRCIAELEGTLGVRLFDRTNRGVKPTPHGEVLLRRASGVFDELRQAVDELAFVTDGSRGELRIGGTPTMCAGILPRAVDSAALTFKRLFDDRLFVATSRTSSTAWSDYRFGPFHFSGDSCGVVELDLEDFR